MGLFSKTKRAHKAVLNQAVKCSEPFDLVQGRVVEVYKNGRWQAGEVQDGYIDLFDPPYYNLAGFDEYPVRKVTPQGARRAAEHYQHKIDKLQAKIDHRFEVEQIAELQAKVTDLELQDIKAKLSAANPPKSPQRGDNRL